MFATIDVLNNEEAAETLCFRSKQDAERFRDFGLTYMRESGAGNGYGAYWLCALDIGQYERPPAKATIGIETARLEDMLQRILKARTATDPPTAKVDMAMGVREGGIVFSHGDLPPRLRPAVGDMFRVIGDELNGQEREVREGRVMADCGETLEVMSSWSENGGRINPNAKRFVMRADKVMKVNDWLKRF